ncbi:hypothetical protein Tco_0286969 [Tanacetum coccineum]
MVDYHFNIDAEVEWVRHSNCGQQQDHEPIPGIVEQIEKNPDIPIRALQDELQKKYELGVSRMKDFKAKSAALNQVKGDYSQQIWFLECLGDDLEMTRESNFTFISDRQKGITIAMTNVSPCTEHKCVAATTIPYFDKAIEELKQFNKQAFEWLAKIPAHSRAKSDILLNNLCEYFNGKILDARDAPIITALEYIREYLMRRMVNVIAVINKIDGPLTPSTTKLLKVAMDKANKYTVSFNEGKSMRKRPSDAGNAPANKKQSTTSSNAGTTP